MMRGTFDSAFSNLEPAHGQNLGSRSRKATPPDLLDKKAGREGDCFVRKRVLEVAGNKNRFWIFLACRTDMVHALRTSRVGLGCTVQLRGATSSWG